MALILLILLAVAGVWLWLAWKRGRTNTLSPVDLSVLPERFVVFDLETTGLDPYRHEIVEIGAIRVTRDSEMHDTFQVLINPKGRISAKITQLTGISRKMLIEQGAPAEQALADFREFVGELPLVAFNAEFDDAFLRATCDRAGLDRFPNEICCALILARQAWPGRRSYRLASLAQDGGLSMEETHRALGDCQRTLIVYAAAARRIGSYR